MFWILALKDIARVSDPMDTRLSCSELGWKVRHVFNHPTAGRGNNPCLCAQPWRRKEQLSNCRPRDQDGSVPFQQESLAWQSLPVETIQKYLLRQCLFQYETRLVKHFPYVIFMPQGSLSWGLMSFSWNICCKIKAACFSAKEIQPGKYREAELGIFSRGQHILALAALPSWVCPAALPQLQSHMHDFWSAWSLR